jgi:hypothetical protein
MNSALLYSAYLICVYVCYPCEVHVLKHIFINSAGISVLLEVVHLWSRLFTIELGQIPCTVTLNVCLF